MFGIPFSRLLKDSHATLISPLDPQTCQDRLQRVHVVFRDGVILDQLVAADQDEDEDEAIGPPETERRARRSDWYGQTLHGYVSRGVLELSMQAPPGHDRVTQLSASFEPSGQGTLIRCRIHAADSEFDGLRSLVGLAMSAVVLLVLVAFGGRGQAIFDVAWIAGLALAAAAYFTVAMLFNRDRYAYHHHHTMVRFVAQITEARLAPGLGLAGTP